MLDAAPETSGSGTAKERGKAPVLQCTPSAATRGVTIGTTATQAQARCPEITLLYRSPTNEQATTALLQTLAGAHTPDFEATAPGLITLDLFSNTAARRDPERIGRDLVDALACENLRARVGFAPTPDLALLAAKLARPVHTIDADPGALARFLSPLPVSLFSPSNELLETLTLWGIHTFGDFLALPAAEVGERLGPEARELRERASSDGRRPLTLVREPQSFDAKHDFEHRVETLEPLTFVFRRLLDTVCSRLHASYQVAGALRLTLKFDNGSAKTRTYRVPDPSADIDLLARIVETGLETESAPAPIVGIKLEASPARAGKHQFGLFESGLRDPHRFAETLAHLEALLGGNRVGTPTPENTHRPDTFQVDRFEPEAASTLGNQSPAIAPVFDLPAGLPLRRFRPPLPVEVALLPNSDAPPRPAALLAGPVRGAIADSRGPWATSGEWWQTDTRWTRQEWDIQLAESGTLYRLVRANEKWQLDGEYG